MPKPTRSAHEADAAYASRIGAPHAILAERDKARDDVGMLKNDLRLMKEQRDNAEAALLSLGWTKGMDKPWTPPPPPTDVIGFAAAADRRETAEQKLHGLGWKLSADGKRGRPSVGGLAPKLVELLDRIIRKVPHGCVTTLAACEVDVIRESVESIRAAEPPRCFETVDWLNGEVLSLLRDLVKRSRSNGLLPSPYEFEVIARAVAAVDQVAAAGANPPGPRPGDWAADFVDGILRRAPPPTATVSRHPDPVTPEKLSARMIAFPVLDAIALLAVVDRDSPVFALATKAGAAIGELEQAVESWLDARAGGA